MVEHNAPENTSNQTPTMLQQLIMGFRTTQLIHVAATLGLADQLIAGPRRIPELAAAVGADPSSLQRLIRALASLGMFAQAEDGAVELTPLAHWLRRDVPGSLHSLAVLYGEAWLWDAYGRMLHSMETGQAAFTHVHGQSFYEYLQQHPSAAETFQRAMTSFSLNEAASIVAASPFSDVRQVVDVGGGEGALLVALLQVHPSMSGIVFDLPTVVSSTATVIERAGLTSRASCVAGDFFASVPGGGDIYILKSVLHNWDDAACIAILRNCRAAMDGGGRVLVMERVVPAGNTASEAKLFDINMLVVLGGQERTEAAYRALFQAAGLSLTRVLPTGTALSIIEGVPEEQGCG
jgi:hypothetical protein